MHPVRVFVLLRGLKSLGTSMQVTLYVPFLLAMGLTLSDVALLNALFYLSIFLLELPTGMVADGKSRAWSVRAGYFALTIGMFAYACAGNFWSALTAEILVGVGFAFISGAFDAWFVDALKKRGEEMAYRRHSGTISIIEAVCSLIGSVAGSFLSPWGGGMAFGAGGVVMAFALLLSFPLLRGENGEPEHHERVGEMEALKLAVRGLRRHPGLRWGAVAATTFGLAIPFNHYWAPFYLGRITQERLIWIWIPIYVSIAFSGWLVRRGTLKIADDRRGMVIALALTGIGLAGIGQLEGLAGPIILTSMHEFGRGLFGPHSKMFFQQRFETPYRATAGSVQSLIECAGWSLVLFVVTFAMRGAPKTDAAISHIWLICGVMLIVLSFLLWSFRPKTDRTFV